MMQLGVLSASERVSQPDPLRHSSRTHRHDLIAGEQQPWAILEVLQRALNDAQVLSIGLQVQVGHWGRHDGRAAAMARRGQRVGVR